MGVFFKKYINSEWMYCIYTKTSLFYTPHNWLQFGKYIIKHKTILFLKNPPPQ